MKRMFKLINKNMEIVISDSGEETKTEGVYLPGGTMSLYTGKIAGMINLEKSSEDRMGRWNSVRIEGGKQKMRIITIYRITN